MSRPISGARGAWSRFWHDFPVYAILLPVTPILFLFSLNHHRIEVGHFLSAALLVTAGYLLSRQLLRICLPGRAWVDPIFAAAFVALAMKAPLGFASSSNLLWLLWCVALTAAFARVPRLRRHAAFALTLVAVAPLAVFAVRTASSPVWGERADLTQRLEANFPPIAIPPSAGEEHPDIYYVVLDRYARADELLEKYGFDNSAFLDRLSDFGFRVVDQAFANYQRTAHSLASTLNMDYLEDFGEAEVGTSFDWLPLYRRITETRLNAFLKERAYEFHFMGTWWEPTRRNEAADYSYNYGAWPELLRVGFENSIVGEGVRQFEFGVLAPRTQQCRRAKYKFDALRSLPDGTGPKFVFAHFLVPHPPFVLDEDGECMSVADTLSRTRQENYIDQLKFANDRILAFVGEVLSRPGPKPIIILQSDEGPWPEAFARDEVLFLGRDVSSVDWLDVSPDLLREKMGILNAVYLPGTDPSRISSSMTPVNTFRIILREYFDVPIDTLSDRNFIFHDNQHIYRFHDVTGALRADDWETEFEQEHRSD